jgi:hypothetical protein
MYRPSIISENCVSPPVIGQYPLVKTELFGGGIIRVEFKLSEIGQKAANAQSREVELVILFGGPAAAT